MTQQPGGVDNRKLIGVVVALAAAVALMVLAFAAPAVNSGAEDLPLALGGPAEATGQVTAALEQQSPGAFEITAHDSPDAAVQAVKDRDAIGAITVSTDGVTIVTASAAGAPYATLLKGLGAGMAANGQQVSYQEVAPYTDDDPTGAGMTAIALPLIFGGMASAVVLSTLFPGARPSTRILASLGFSVLAGLAITAILQFGFGSLAGSYWLTSLSVGMGIAAVSLVVLGLESLLGYAGLGIGAILMLFVANPLAGIATGPHWLPHPWGALGQLLPIGAAGTAVRSMSFFDGRGAQQALLVLSAWIVVGLVLCLLPGRASRESAATP